MEIFRGFRVFKYAQTVKNENPKMLEINIKFSKLKKHLMVKVIITRKLLKSYQFVI